MFRVAKNIVSHDPSREVWKYLRLFLNVEATANKIRAIHKVPEGTHVANIRKQATQVAYCIRQAEEYFEASERVELATRPLLLYYGCVSLTQALVLLKKDGTFSLDASRQNGRNNHHGLELSRGLAEEAAQARTLEEFFSKIECKCRKNSGGEPVGHFPLVYGCLEAPAFNVHTEFHEWGRATAHIESDEACPCADVQPLTRISEQRFMCWELLKYLPDLYNSMYEAGVRPKVKRGAVMRMVVNYYAPRPLNAANDSAPTASVFTPILDREVDTHHFYINHLSSDEKADLLRLRERNPRIRVQDEFPSNLHLVLEVETKAGATKEIGYYPDIVEDIYGEKYFMLNPEYYVTEPASFLILTFCLGMLSRYFPDVWMTITDSRVEIAEMTNTLLGIIHRKFPNLILDQMTDVKHYIHS